MSRFLRPANVLDLRSYAGCICQLLDRAAVLLYNYGLNPAPCFYSSLITKGTDYISILPRWRSRIPACYSRSLILSHRLLSVLHSF